MSMPEPVKRALALSAGASFVKCALQVNPFPYLAKSGKTTSYDEGSYNEVLVAAFLEHEIRAIGVADHHNVDSSQSLCEVARQAGITVFPGFEAKSKEGVHFLCLFDSQSDTDVLNRHLGECGIKRAADEPEPCKYDASQLLARVGAWGGVAVAAHATNPGGILKTLSGKARANVWTDPELLAVAIPGSVEDLPNDLKVVVTGKAPEYRRTHPIAVLNAADVSDPSQVGKPGSWTWIKMSSVSIDGLRQAFLDPESRVRLSSDSVPPPHTELVAVAWEGGFLDGVAIHLNENLNVLIGGRGAGKSTMIESLRYAFDVAPIGKSAAAAHEGFVRNVLRPGTKVYALVSSPRPSQRRYLVERTVPDPPVVRGEDGALLSLRPSDVVPHLEVYGQHELAELAELPERRARLLERFVSTDHSDAATASGVIKKLAASRKRLVEIEEAVVDIDDRLSEIPAIEEQLKRYEEAGIEAKLRDQGQLGREDAIIARTRARVEPIRDVLRDLSEQVPFDRAFLSDQAVEDLPHRELLHRADAVLAVLEARLVAIRGNLEEVLLEAESGLSAIATELGQLRSATQAELEKTLRSLQTAAVDGQQFLNMRRRLEDLRPLLERRALLGRERKERLSDRGSLLDEWRNLHSQRFRLLERAAKKVSKDLAPLVRAQVTFQGDREPLVKLLEKRIGGRLDRVRERVRTIQDLSLIELAATCREGAAAVSERYGVSGAQAEALAGAPASVLMEIEELELGPTTDIELNIAAEGEPHIWRRLEDLSTGQKATALLLLLLLESTDPLVIDQPEDDLDNRFITEGIVPRVRDEKRRRQFIFSSHNANIPVLGDAELIAVLRPLGDGGVARAGIAPNEMGSIDDPQVRLLVEELLEGGREAFESRRRKYGF